jgi:phosphoglycerate dehydrogenase-like enzyme
MSSEPRPLLVIYTHPASAAEFSAISGQFPELDVRIEESPEEFDRLAEQADIICMARRYKRHTVLAAKRLKWLHVGGTGVDRLLPFDDLDPALVITNTPALNADMMADYVLCTILMLTWDFPRMLRNQASRTWDRWMAERAAGKVVTIVGLGGIGLPVLSRVSALGMRVIGVRRSAEPVPGVERVFGPEMLHEALAAGDYVVLAVPLTEHTRGLMGPRELAAMKRSAFLINISRGKVVQEAALVSALKRGQIAGAALDVFEEEPLPPESELWDLENAILSPHVSSWSTDYRPRAAAILTENVVRYLAGQPLLHRIDRTRGY